MSTSKDRLSAARRYLNAVVHNSGVCKLKVQRLIDKTVSEIQKLIKEDPDSDLSSIYLDFKAKLQDIIEENMEAAISLAEERSDSEKGAFLFLLKDIQTSDNNLVISKATEAYRQNLSEEVKYFLSCGYPIAELSRYISDPLSYIAMQEGNQGEFKAAIPSIGSGCSYKIMATIWAILNFSSVKAHNIALSAIWKLNGVIGYVGHRNSTLYCPLCDEYCNELWPIDGEMWFPVHPYCVCSVVEVYAGETWQ